VITQAKSWGCSDILSRVGVSCSLVESSGCLLGAANLVIFFVVFGLAFIEVMFLC
jgi:hypothetical protein